MTRFLLIGLDGAEPSLVEAWMDAGHLPNLARLRSGGSFLPLESTSPPATFPAWTTCVTGVNPGRHGIFDFTEICSADGRPAVRFVNSTFRRVPAIWNTLSDAGKRVCVLGVPGTYPPEPVNGCMVSGFDSPVCGRVDRSFVYPREMYGEVREWRYADFEETRITPGWHAKALRRILSKIEDKERIAVQMLRREPWDFFMCVFGESDAAAHHFWQFHDAASPRHRPGLPDAIRDVYARLDLAVGALVADAGPGSVVAVVSDHGSGGVGTGVVHLNNWLAERGYLRFTGGRGGRAKKAALAIAPQRLRGALFRRFGGVAARAETADRLGGIDWRQTRAWSEELTYFPSVRIHNVAPSDYEAFCTDLCAELEGWGPIKKAWRREQLYQGPYVDGAPDIVLELELENGYACSCLRGRGGPSLRRLEASEYLGAKGGALAGNHRPMGICLISEPTPAGAASIEDIAPTVLAALDTPGPTMDGTPLIGRVRAAGDYVLSGAKQTSPYSPEQQRAVEQRLRALGYFE